MVFLGGYVYKKAYMRILAGCFDLIGWVLFGILRFLQSSFDENKVRRILVIRLDHLGDVVMTRPVLRALRSHFPDATIDLLVSHPYAELCRSWPEVSSVISFSQSWFSPRPNLAESFYEAFSLGASLSKEPYDLGIDFRGDVRHVLLMALSCVRFRLGRGDTGGRFFLSREGKPVGEDVHQTDKNNKLLAEIGISSSLSSEKTVPDHEKQQLFWGRHASLLKPTSVISRVIIHAEAGDPQKRWSKKNFKELIQKLLEKVPCEIVVIGVEQDDFLLRDLSSDQLIDLREKTQVADLPILFDSAALFIGNDSGPAHIAGMQGLRSIVIFSGKNKSSAWKPFGNELDLFEPAPQVAVDHVASRAIEVLKGIS